MKSSTEWVEIEAKLLSNANKLSDPSDFRRMIKNVSNSVKELSKAEVEARRGKKQKAEELLKQINEDIDTIKDFLIVATIIG